MSENNKMPAPVINTETQPFWDATCEGKLLIKRCHACNEFHWYPRTICPFCHSDDTRWQEASGKGEIYSYSVMRRTGTPFALAYVTLEEGITMMTHIVDCDYDALAIGQQVEVTFKETDEEGALVPCFKPA